ncbi:PHP domain-containing protein [Kineococcus indalonis]|uniref:PHP domain-containing protein n=1 Tax=Kineococcus indalonis TaxID=2696566 RepID=UPI0014121C4E|nr:PHP domain-containing protein [Kineococcus indalonis]NAZ88202.1 PHP domain-containing protein [Kineococcus indalonis]
MRIDLHTHSTASDGTEPPSGVVGSAARAGLDVVALTDHDTTDGWAEALAAGERLGVRVVPGMEVSCLLRGVSVHLLSYWHDPADPALEAMLDASRTSRRTRARRMVERMTAETGLCWEDVLAHVHGEATIGRPHIADALVAAGVVADRDEAFATLLSGRSPYFVPHTAPDPLRAIALVRAAGGVPVLAHPAASKRGSCVGDADVEAMVGAGLLGVEVDHRDHSEDERRHLRELARSLDLLVTGSSDYHGTGKRNLLGENTTAPEVLQEIESRARGAAAAREVRGA